MIVIVSKNCVEIDIDMEIVNDCEKILKRRRVKIKHTIKHNDDYDYDKLGSIECKHTRTQTT